ncbi:MAG: leucyl/phenylalanyl-tRNA--protein transferase [Sphingomonas sp.]|jgi:leucyl/phenylalanyl-tRNA--protein transferase
MLDAHMLLGAYAVGVFPMAEHRAADEVFWVEPKRRAILPLDGFHLSRSLRKTLAQNRFHVTADTAFGRVISLCAEAADDRADTWINPGIEHAFCRLHAMGYAHSVECWEEDRLVGGLYGLALGRAFFGESMFSRARDTSKVALAWLVARLRVGGFTLLDCQFQTDHLASLGAIEISRNAYLGLLSTAIDGAAGLGLAAAGGAPGAGAASASGPDCGVGAESSPSSADFFALERGAALATTTVSGPVDGKLIVQLLTQTS